MIRNNSAGPDSITSVRNIDKSNRKSRIVHIYFHFKVRIDCIIDCFCSIRKQNII